VAARPLDRGACLGADTWSAAGIRRTASGAVHPARSRSRAPGQPHIRPDQPQVRYYCNIRFCAEPANWSRAEPARRVAVPCAPGPRPRVSANESCS
jgi:hypothetical protein